MSPVDLRLSVKCLYGRVPLYAQLGCDFDALKQFEFSSTLQTNEVHTLLLESVKQIIVMDYISFPRCFGHECDIFFFSD